MGFNLTEKEIKELIQKEKGVKNRYADDIDVTIDNIVSLYEAKKIDDKTLKIALSLALTAATKETVSNLNTQFLRKNIMGRHTEDPNKLLLVNYSKTSYA